MAYKNKADKVKNWRRYYLKHKDRIKVRSMIFKISAKKRNRKFIVEYLKSHPCVDCGASDFRILEFDHLKNKKRAVSELVLRACSIDTIKQEIDKCQVCCANCHRIRTYNRRQKKQYE
jgi:hypothetical protein